MRDPLAMLVSGYLYHRTGAEQWCRRPIEDAGAMFPRFGLGLAAVADAAGAGGSGGGRKGGAARRAGAAANASAAPLPALHPRESYAKYLRRLAPLDGLPPPRVLFGDDLAATSGALCFEELWATARWLPFVPAAEAARHMDGFRLPPPVDVELRVASTPPA